MKPISLLFAFLAFHFCIYSQDSLTTDFQKTPETFHSSSMVIKGEDISRFPTDNFLEAVAGLFPGVFINTMKSNDFLFIVNGNLLSDISGISLYDIEEVSFTQTNLNGSYFPFSRAGIFVIKTKTNNMDKIAIRFNSQFNSIRNNDFRPPPPGAGVPGFQVSKDDINHKGGYWAGNHLSLSFQKKKWQVYSSVQYDHIRDASYDRLTVLSTPVTTDTITGYNGSNRRNLKFFLNIIYKFSDKLESGFSGNYATQERKGTAGGQNNSSISENKLHSTVNHYNGTAFIKWKPHSNINNTLSVEYTNDQLDQTLQYSSLYPQSPNINTQGFDTTSAYLKQSLFRNRFQYTFPVKSKFKVETGFTFSYLHQNLWYNQKQYVSIPGFPPAFNSYFYGNKDFKFTTLTPEITLSYGKTIYLHSGYGFILNKEYKNISARSRNNFYTNLDIDLKNAFHVSDRVKQLTLSFSYSNLIQNITTSYWLNNQNIGQRFYPWLLINGPDFTLPGNIPPPWEIFKNKLAGIQLNMQIGSRLSAMAGWSTLQSDGLRLDSYNGMIAGPSARIKSSSSGFMFSGSYQAIDDPKKNWTIGINLNFPRTEVEEQPPFSKTDVYYKTTIGLNNIIRLNKFSGQLNILAGDGRQVYNYNSFQRTSGSSSDLLLRYLMIGYDIARQLKIFVHVKNIAANKDQKQYYQYDRYAGAGINYLIK